MHDGGEKLVRLKGEMAAALAKPAPEAGPSHDELRERLVGIEASLAETSAALAGARTGG